MEDVIRNYDLVLLLPVMEKIGLLFKFTFNNLFIKFYGGFVPE